MENSSRKRDPMEEGRFMRQRDLIPYDRMRDLPVTVIGVGAVGSHVVQTLAKMGFRNITVFDGDDVSEHNLPNQGYRPCDVGKKKVECLKEIVSQMTGVEIRAKPENYTSWRLRGVVVCCVDSMDARLKIWNEVKMHLPDLYIDTRMGAEVGKVYPVFPPMGTSREWYEGTLHGSDEAFKAPCTAKATLYCASGLASIVAAELSAYLNSRELTAVTVDFRLMMLLQQV